LFAPGYRVEVGVGVAFVADEGVHPEGAGENDGGLAEDTDEFVVAAELASAEARADHDKIAREGFEVIDVAELDWVLELAFEPREVDGGFDAWCAKGPGVVAGIARATGHEFEPFDSVGPPGGFGFGDHFERGEHVDASVRVGLRESSQDFEATLRPRELAAAGRNANGHPDCTGSAGGRLEAGAFGDDTNVVAFALENDGRGK